MGVMREQKKARECAEKRARARDSWCGAAFDVFAGLELNVQLTEGKALFHGGNMKVDVLVDALSEFSLFKKIKRGHAFAQTCFYLQP